MTTIEDSPFLLEAFNQPFFLFLNNNKRGLRNVASLRSAFLFIKKILKGQFRLTKINFPIQRFADIN